MPIDINTNERSNASRQQSNSSTRSRNGLYSGNAPQQITVQQRPSSNTSTTSAPSETSTSGSNGSNGSNEGQYVSRAAAQEEAQRREAERQAALARERERVRNEQLRRNKDAKLARDAQEAQQERRDSRTSSAKAAGLDTRREAAPEKVGQEQASRRVTPVTVDDVIAGGSVASYSRPAATRMESTGYLDTDTGEIVDTASPASRVDRILSEELERAKKERADARMARSKMAESIDQIAAEEVARAEKERANARAAALARDNSNRQRLNRISAEELARANTNDALDAMQAYVRENSYEDDLEARQYYDKDRASDILDEQIDQIANDLVDEREAYEREQRAEDVGAGNVDSIPGENNQDTPWEIGSDITGIRDSSDREKIRKILEDENKRQSLSYEAIEEKEDSTGNFEDQRNGIFPTVEGLTGMEDESTIVKTLMQARNKMYQRWLNPALLRVESEHVVERTEGSGKNARTYGTIGYSDRVEKAIGSVRNLYNCSIYNVMQLVQLRGGIGVDSKGTIAKVDPNEFRLTDDQFVELCRDIVTSQQKNGNPLGPVEGTPGGSGVRDDTGRYVVVAKTRCFPLGYMPRRLIEDLSREWSSPLHDKPIRQLQKEVGEQWLNETYPTLLANTEGNLVFQARAIENMMRGMMMIDGVNPADLSIPEIVEHRTLMFHRSELESAVDPQIAESIKARQEYDEEALSRFKHRAAKRNGVRDANGNIQAGELRRIAKKMDQAALTLSTFRRAGRALKTMVMVSGAIEGVFAEGQMAVANLAADVWFKSHHGDMTAEYEVTDELRSMSASKEAVEARSIAESLYRAGGLDMLRAFITELGDDGRSKYRLNQRDLRQFFYDYGFSDKNPQVSEEARQKFGIKPGQEAGFLYNVQNVADTLDNIMLGSSSMFKENEARQFVKMSMAEMGRARVAGRESYTNSQVADWGARDGGEGLVRSLLQTDAGLEAFMTQGITGLGRKSPLQNRMRAVLGASGVTNLAVREMFGLFIEYGVSKMVRMIPMSNTLSYLSSRGIKKVGDLMAAESGKLPLGGVPNFANAMQRNFDYQVGSRLELKEGLAKNLRYDMIMAGTELGKALVVCALIQAFGGLFPPDEEDEKYTFSEWKIGGEDGLPIKFAWWVDDLAGLGLPLGMSLAMLDQYGWDSDESKKVATNGFINMVANFNQGTALFNAIDFVTNPAAYLEDFIGTNVDGYDPSFAETSQAWMKQQLWNILGDMTPAFIGEWIPWSRDYLFKGDADEHTPYKYYDSEGKEQSVGDYSELMKRMGARNNWLQALFYDFTKSDDVSSYKYAEMPLATRTDPMALKLYNDFYLDVDDLPIDQDERIDYLNGMAESVISHIDQNYENVDQAVSQGLVLNYEQIRNCRRYCYDMIDKAEADFQAELDRGRMPNDQFYARQQEVKDLKQYYYDLVDEYFKDNTKIPTSVPKYVKQETDSETKYVDDQNRPMNYLDTILGNAHAEEYRYGNIPSVLPISQPRRNETTGYNFERIPYWVRLDDDGNPISDVGSMYDLAGELGPIVSTGKFSGKDLQELQWGGQGNNMYDDVSERLNIPREGVPTVGERALRIDDEDIPESLRKMTDADMFGISESDDNADDDKSSSSSSTSGGSYYPGSSYVRSYGGRSGGGYYSGGYSSNYSSAYNPKIYSTAKQVYGDRASGMQTRQPYNATTTYLRPNFYTKGSREAYKRSDI